MSDENIQVKIKDIHEIDKARKNRVSRFAGKTGIFKGALSGFYKIKFSSEDTPINFYAREIEEADLEKINQNKSNRASTNRRTSKAKVVSPVRNSILDTIIQEKINEHTMFSSSVNELVYIINHDVRNIDNEETIKKAVMSKLCKGTSKNSPKKSKSSGNVTGDCPDGQEKSLFNPSRCVNQCKDYQERNPSTGRCINIKNSNARTSRPKKVSPRKVSPVIKTSRPKKVSPVIKTSPKQVIKYDSSPDLDLDDLDNLLNSPKSSINLDDLNDLLSSSSSSPKKPSPKKPSPKTPSPKLMIKNKTPSPKTPSPKKPSPSESVSSEVYLSDDEEEIYSDRWASITEIYPYLNKHYNKWLKYAMKHDELDDYSILTKLGLLEEEEDKAKKFLASLGQEIESDDDLDIELDNLLNSESEEELNASSNNEYNSSDEID